MANKILTCNENLYNEKGKSYKINLKLLETIPNTQQINISKGEQYFGQLSVDPKTAYIMRYPDKQPTTSELQTFVDVQKQAITSSVEQSISYIQNKIIYITMVPVYDDPSKFPIPSINPNEDNKYTQFAYILDTDTGSVYVFGRSCLNQININININEKITSLRVYNTGILFVITTQNIYIYQVSLILSQPATTPQPTTKVATENFEQFTVPEYNKMSETEKIIAVIVSLILIMILLKMFKVF